MWSDCDFHPASTIRTLVQRSLLRINEDKQFWMHEHVRDLGRAIVREENNQNPYKRSRIWSNRDAIDMLENKEGSDCVEALRVDMRGENFVLKNKHLKRLSRLRYLQVWNGSLSGNYDNVLPNLRWLRLHHCDSFPTSLNLKKLIILGLEDCSVRDGWGGWNNVKVSSKLKVVNLTRCTYLKKVPDLSNCGGLELLDFCGCRNMHGELDIGSFDNIRSLGVKRTQITKVESKLSSLEFLDLTSTYFTDMLPDGLKSLAISSYSLPDLPSSLNYLEICYSMHLQKLPNLANLIHLTELRLDEVDIREIPGFGDLKMLEYLVIRLAPKLDNLSGLDLANMLPASLSVFTKLWRLTVDSCFGHDESNHRMPIEHFLDLSSLKNLRDLKITCLPELVVVTGLSRLESLEFLEIQQCVSIRTLPDLSGLMKLKRLDVRGCTRLTEVAGLGGFRSLEDLLMSGIAVN
ncbi:Disease resistance protein L6 [Linum perenne]